MFPEDFFGNPNQYKTIQTQINKNKEHPKIINPSLIMTKSNKPMIIEIKEEKCEESMDIAKNKNSYKINVPQNISNEEISTSGGSYNTPKTPNIPIKTVVHTEPNKNKKCSCNIKDKLIPNNSLNKNIINNHDNNIKDENFDLYYPMAFTFNFKEKNCKTLNNNRRNNYKYNKSFERNKKNNGNKEKTIKEKKRKILSCQKYKEDKIKIENIFEINNSKKNYNNKKNNIHNKGNKTLNASYRKSYSTDINKNNHKKENNLNNINSQKEKIKNSRKIFCSINDRKAKSAKKSEETISIISIKNNKNLLRRNNKDNKNDFYTNNNNLKIFKSEFDNQKKEIINTKLKDDIENILYNLPDNYEKIPKLKNKFELLMKNVDDIKYVLNNNKKKFSDKK